MRITCPKCEAQYEVDEFDIPVEGQDVQCSDCETVWMQKRDGTVITSEPEDESAEVEVETTIVDDNVVEFPEIIAEQVINTAETVTDDSEEFMGQSLDDLEASVEAIEDAFEGQSLNEIEAAVEETVEQSLEDAFEGQSLDEIEAAVEETVEQSLEDAFEGQSLDEIEAAVEETVEQSLEDAFEGQSLNEIEAAVEETVEQNVEDAFEGQSLDEIEAAVEETVEQSLEDAFEGQSLDEIEAAVEETVEQSLEDAFEGQSLDEIEAAVEETVEQNVEDAFEGQSLDEIEAAVEETVEQNVEDAFEGQSLDEIEAAVEETVEQNVEDAFEGQSLDEIEAAIEETVEQTVDDAFEGQSLDEIEAAVEDEPIDKNLYNIRTHEPLKNSETDIGEPAEITESEFVAEIGIDDLEEVSEPDWDDQETALSADEEQVGAFEIENDTYAPETIEDVVEVEFVEGISASVEGEIALVDDTPAFVDVPVQDVPEQMEDLELAADDNISFDELDVHEPSLQDLSDTEIDEPEEPAFAPQASAFSPPIQDTPITRNGFLAWAQSAENEEVEPEAIEEDSEIEVEQELTIPSNTVDKRALFETLKAQIQAEDAAEHIEEIEEIQDVVEETQEAPEVEVEQVEPDFDETALLETFRAQLEEEDKIESSPAAANTLDEMPDHLIGHRARSNLDGLDDFRSGRVKLTGDDLAVSLPKKRFRRGFILTMVLFVIAAALYLASDLIVAQVPALASTFDIYVAGVDFLRLQAGKIGDVLWGWTLQGIDWAIAKINAI